MSSHNFINTLICGDQINGYYIANSMQVCTAKNGNPYLAITLQDRTGTISGKFWDYSGSLSAENAGEVVRVSGTVSEYRGKPQITLQECLLADDSEVEHSDLVPVAPIDVDAYMAEMDRMIYSILDQDLRKICSYILSKYRTQIRVWPAAKSVHHAFRSGLLMHTVDMMHTAESLVQYYGDTIDRDLLLAGTFLHDIGKLWEFKLSKLGLAVDYTSQGLLLGHPAIGAQLLTEVQDVSLISDERLSLLQHMLLSHHGKREYGAAVEPQCVEAELLSAIDMMDSRKEIYRTATAQSENTNLSEYIPALGRRVYVH